MRWLRNLLQVIRADHPALGTHVRLSESDLFGDESDAADRSTGAKGKLQLIPCYRAPLRQRWRLGSDDPKDASIEQIGFIHAMSSSSPADEAADKTASGDFVVDEPEPAAGGGAASSPPPSGKMSGKEAASRLMMLRSKRLQEANAARRRAAATAALNEPRFVPATDLVHRPYTDSNGRLWADVPARVTGHAPSAFFLCAHPVMPGFFLGNVLLVHHIDPNQGAVGFTINRPLRNNDGVPVPVWAVFAQEPQSPTAVLRYLEDNRIFVAGPVSVVPPPLPMGPASASASASGAASSGAAAGERQTQREQDFLSVAHFLHRIPGVPFAQPVAPGVWWNGDQRVIGAKLESKEASPRDVMVLIGHSGWGPQQLEGEICSGSWLTAVSRSEDDDRIFKQQQDGAAVRRPFASPSNDEKKRAAKKSDSSDDDVGNNKEASGEVKKNEGEEKEEAAAPTLPLPTRFDCVADFIFAGNVPVSKEDRLFEFKKKDADCLVHLWREFVARLGAPGLARMAALTPDGDWMATAADSSKQDDGDKSKPPSPGARSRASAGAKGSTGAGTTGTGPNV